MVRGSEIEGHVFQLDGADVGSFRASRADYIQLSTDAIQDVQGCARTRSSIAAPDPKFGPSTVTLSNGRKVSNPLGTASTSSNAASR